MKFETISPKTINAFSCSLAPNGSDRGAIARCAWYADNLNRGAGYCVLTDDEENMVGKCQTMPIEYSPLEGENLLVILCLYVHMYKERVGDQRGKGYGSFMLEQVEVIAKENGYQGVAVWAMDWDWNPVSFYQEHGYEIADREDKVVAAWKPFSLEAIPPHILRYTPPEPEDPHKVQVVVVDNAFCNGYDKRSTVREALCGLEYEVEYIEAPLPYMGRMLHLGPVGGVFIDGKPYRPYELIGKPAELREEIMRRYAVKNPKGHRAPVFLW